MKNAGKWDFRNLTEAQIQQLEKAQEMLPPDPILGKTRTVLSWILMVSITYFSYNSYQLLRKQAALVDSAQSLLNSVK